MASESEALHVVCPPPPSAVRPAEIKVLEAYAENSQPFVAAVSPLEEIHPRREPNLQRQSGALTDLSAITLPKRLRWASAPASPRTA